MPPASRSGIASTPARVIIATVARPSSSTFWRSSAVAAIVTGARISSAKGFESPPVSATRIETWIRSKASCCAAWVPSGREPRRVSARFTTAAMATTPSTSAALNRSPSSIAAATAQSCPASATQRSSTRVRRRIGSFRLSGEPDPVRLAMTVPSLACGMRLLDSPAAMGDQCAAPPERVTP